MQAYLKYACRREPEPDALRNNIRVPIPRKRLPYDENQLAQEDDAPD